MDKLVVEICYGENSINIFFASMTVGGNTTVKEVLGSCGVLTEYPLLNAKDITVGVNSKSATLDAVVKNNDRIVIYRPLKILPQEARRLRANKNKIK